MNDQAVIRVRCSMMHRQLENLDIEIDTIESRMSDYRRSVFPATRNDDCICGKCENCRKPKKPNLNVANQIKSELAAYQMVQEEWLQVLNKYTELVQQIPQ